MLGWDLQQHRQDLKVELQCFLPGWEKKRLCQKMVKKNKVTVFQFSLFSAIYKRSSEFWIKVNFSRLESYWVSRLVVRCRVTLHAWRTSKTVRSLKIDVHTDFLKPVHECMASAFRMRFQQSSDWYWDGMRVFVLRQVNNHSLRVQWTIL